MLNRCDTLSKWVEIEFCEEILVETVSLANFELFSSMFKEFKILVNNRYPPGPKHPWKLLGTFHAKNLRGKQLFEIENPQIWAKYLRVEFMTHYGTEYYCPFSQVKVFGTTMMEEVQATENEPPPKPQGRNPLEDIPETGADQNDHLDLETSNTAVQVTIPSSFAFPGTFTCSVTDQASESKVPDNNGDKTVPSPKNIQESIFKNMMKRLGTLEESAVFTRDFLNRQKEELQQFLRDLEVEQGDLLYRFLEEQWSDESVLFEGNVAL